MLRLISLLATLCCVQGVYYDSYTGEQISNEAYTTYVESNITTYCVKDVKDCDPDEGRRVDGSCNNLNNPSRGTTHTPFSRLLDPEYYFNNDTKEFESKKAKSGNDLPLPRYVRTQLTATGSVPSQTFTPLPLYYMLLIPSDTVTLLDTENYIFNKPYCCDAKGKTDSSCVSNKIPDDDPVHRFSDIRCLNLTRPESFQSNGCASKSTAPDRLVSSTPLIDLSGVYGNTQAKLDAKGRKFEGGLLKYEVEEGRIWPPSTTTATNACKQNKLPRETRCLDTPESSFNGLAGGLITKLWFYRQHNFIAEKLAAVNPSWNDEKLFTVARDINIAIADQIMYYELFPALMGRSNLESDGVISNSSGFRDLYDENMTPNVLLEFPFALRWVHTMQDGALKMYDSEGYYLKTEPIVNLTLRSGFFAIDNNIDGMTQGSFRQASGNIDYIVDPDIVNIGMGPFQKSLDIVTNDLTKNRLFGFPPYIKYREFCFGDSITSFSDLKGIIDPERIEVLKSLYESYEDIDVMAGMIVEKPIAGGAVPPTFYCIIANQLMHNMVSDRHWYERPCRPNAYKAAQLAEVRKATVAMMLCNVGDTVTKIQPNAFLRAGVNNEMRDCSEIENMDFSAWGEEDSDTE